MLPTTGVAVAETGAEESEEVDPTSIVEDDMEDDIPGDGSGVGT